MAGLAEVDERVSFGTALCSLSADDQEICRLVAWEDLDVKGVAQVLGVSVPTAAVRVHRSRRRLQQAIGNSLENDSLNMIAPKRLKAKEATQHEA